MSSKLEPVICSCDTGHIGIHGAVDGRRVLRSHDDENQFNNDSKILGCSLANFNCQ